MQSLRTSSSEDSKDSYFFADDGDLLLANCSQDSFIRIWRISRANKIQEHNTLNDELEELKLTSNVFSVTDKGRYLIITYVFLIKELFHTVVILRKVHDFMK